MNKELAKVSSYMKENTLLINQGKTVHLLTKPKKAKNLVIKEKLMLDGTEVKRVKNSRFLGIWFDDALRFDKQFQVI